MYSINKYQRRKHWLNLYKVKKKCQVCGYDRNPYALHFDHIVYPKFMQISKMLKKYRLKRLFEEIRKCQVLCANCHAVKSCGDEREKYGYEQPPK
jgi:hypothetical protein|tara:strand:- start:195 stop:479 length:285 start_codon:yes stop_codon:yes gene_type:complete